MFVTDQIQITLENYLEINGKGSMKGKPRKEKQEKTSRYERLREERAKVILSKDNAVRMINKGVFLVQSQKGSGHYLIEWKENKWMCTCLDFTKNNRPCKHVFAVKYYLTGYVAIEGEQPEIPTVTYSQDWASYNLTQTNEFRLFQDILIELVDSLIEVNQPYRIGHPFNDLKEMIYCCIMRAYYGKSSRRSVSFLDYGLEKGYITKKPHFNTILNYYKDSTITPILKYLIEKSGSPLRHVEKDFTTDSSGFSTSLFGRWLDVRTQENSYRRIFKKVHVTSGVKTNIITAIEVTPGFWADSPQFKKLIQITSRTFEIREVSADKAYSSRKNLRAVAALGGVPFIPFKEGSTRKSKGCMIWGRMKKMYDKNPEYFMGHYHKRSNAESVFSMIKRKFGHHLYSKSEVGQINEILCKALAHNICVLIAELYELHIKVKYNYCAKLRVAH